MYANGSHMYVHTSVQVCLLPVGPCHIAPQLHSPSEVAAAGAPDNEGEEEHHSSDDQHKVQHTPLCKGGKGWAETWTSGCGGRANTYVCSNKATETKR